MSAMLGACLETVTARPDGAYLYITQYDACSVSAVNLTTGDVIAVALPDAPLAVMITPDSAHAYVGQCAVAHDDRHDNH